MRARPVTRGAPASPRESTPVGRSTTPSGPSRLRAGLYHADGQQLDEVYEYGSFRQSKMYQRGVRCSDCHNPHSGKIKAEGNAVCAQCHRPEANSRFPTLAHKVYDAPVHHFHKAGSPGRPVRQLPHAHQGLHDRGRAAGSHPAATPARSLGQARDAECVHRLPP